MRGEQVKFRFLGRTIEVRASATSSLPAPWNDSAWQSVFRGYGYTVSAETALQISAVFRCVDLVSKTMASLPLHMFESTKDGKRKATEHRVYPLVYALPNYQATAYDFWQMYTANLLLTRGAFAKIKRDTRGFISALWNIPTKRVGGIYINSVTGERYIDVASDGTWEQGERLYEGEFLYTPGFLFSDRNVPSDPMFIAASVLGLTDKLGQYANSAVNGVNPGGFIEHPMAMSDQAYERFKKDFEASYMGALNNGKFLFLEEGAKAQLLERDMEKMQVLESRKWAVTEVCRIFGVPPHLCMDLGNATFSNIEQQSLEYVRDCVDPLAVRLEQSMFRDLLTTSERIKYFFKFNLNGLLRGDTATRASFYHSMRQDGVYSANDIREKEDENQIPKDQGGDEYLVNGNMIPMKYAANNTPKSMQGASK